MGHDLFYDLLEPEDVNPPKPKPWIPAEEDWPEEPDLSTRVAARQEFHRIAGSFKEK